MNKSNHAKVLEIVEKWSLRKDRLIEILQDVQEEYRYLPKETLTEISKTLEIPLSQIYTIATFYAYFSLDPKGEHQINVCLGTACHVQGGDRVSDALQRELNIKVGTTSKDMKFSLKTVRCIGCCGLAPVIVIDKEMYGNVTASRIKKILKKYKK